MYLLLPLLLIAGSISGIFIIVWRKAPYIKKLATPDGPTLNGNGISKKEYFFKLFSEFFPEIGGTFKNIKFKEYKDAWLVEVEKFLRRLRLVSLRMDRWSNSWIQGIRKHVDKSTAQTTTPVPTPTSEVGEVLTSDVNKLKTKTEEKVSETELFKKEEQRIIIEIARNPKNSKLYDALGDLYVKMSDYSDGKESYEAALELDPNNEELKKKLSLALEKSASQN